MRRSHAHEIGVFRGITLIFATERPGTGPGANASQLVVQNIMNVVIAATEALAAPKAASPGCWPGFSKVNRSTRRSSARLRQRGAVLRESRSAQRPNPRAGRKLPHRTREHVLCGNRGGFAPDPDRAPMLPASTTDRWSGRGGVGDPVMNRYAKARRQPVGWVGYKRSAMCKKILASNRCLSIGRR